MQVLTLTSIIVSIIFYFVVGGVSLGFSLSDTDETCSNHNFMTLEQWMLGVGLGHIMCGGFLSVAAQTKVTDDINIIVGIVGITALVYVFTYSFVGAFVLSASKYCLIVKEPLYTMAVIDVVFNFAFFLAMGVAIIIIIAKTDRPSI